MATSHETAARFLKLRAAKLKRLPKAKHRRRQPRLWRETPIAGAEARRVFNDEGVVCVVDVYPDRAEIAYERNGRVWTKPLRWFMEAYEPLWVAG